MSEFDQFGGHEAGDDEFAQFGGHSDPTALAPTPKIQPVADPNPGKDQGFSPTTDDAAPPPADNPHDPQNYLKNTALPAVKNAVMHPIDTVKSIANGIATDPLGALEGALNPKRQLERAMVNTYKDSVSAGNSHDDAVKDALNSGLSYTGMIAVGHGAGKVLGGLGKAAGTAATDAAGVAPETIERYKANPEAVNAAGAKYGQDPNLLKSEIGSTVTKSTDAVADAGQAAADANENVDATKQATQSDLRDARDDARQTRRTNRAATTAERDALTATNADNANLLADSRFAAGGARTAANQAASDAFTTAKEDLGNVRPPEAVVSDLPDSLDATGKKLSEASGKAFDILDNSGVSFDVNDLQDAVDGEMGKLKTSGVAPGIGPDAQAYGALQKFKNWLGEIGEKHKVDAPQKAGPGGYGLEPQEQRIPAAVVKEQIQTLDSVSKGAYEKNAGELGPEGATKLARVRSSFNRMLREASPAPETPTPPDPAPTSYAEAMDRLAPQVGLLSDMSKVFGDEANARQALQAMGDPKSVKGYMYRKMLAEYDKTAGTKFGQQLDAYNDAQATLRSPTARKALQAGLPESQVAASTLPEEAALADAQTQARTTSQARQASLQQARKAALAASDAAQDRLQDVKQSALHENDVAQTVAKQAGQDHADLQMWNQEGGLNRLEPNSIDSTLKQIQGGDTGPAADSLKFLDDMHGTNHFDNAKDAAAAKEFQPGRPSLNTTLPGYARGLVKQYGAPAVKMALDAGIQLDRLTPEWTKTLLSAAAQSPAKFLTTQYLYKQQQARKGDGVQ